MTAILTRLAFAKPIHHWLRVVTATHVPGASTPMLDSAIAKLLARFRAQGHKVTGQPDGTTDVIVTSALFGEPVGWRDSMLFTGRRRFNLSRTPAVFTLIHVTPQQLETTLGLLATHLSKEKPDPADFEYPGLAPRAYRTLIEQGRRGGPMMALVRLLQAQSKSIRIILCVGVSQPQAAYYFDLVGAYPRIEAVNDEAFFDDMVLRIVTSVSTSEVTRHEARPDILRRAVWDALSTPQAMRRAGMELGKRQFFTEMVRIADLVHVPSLADTVASQYSEGCFATWDPALEALIATVTGSARPVEKENITEDELAVIVGVRPDGMGAIVRHVEGKQNDPPSSEAVEMMDMDSLLPRVTLAAEWGSAASANVPVVRSKLHGHRGVSAYDPQLVEFVPLDLPYYHYPVSCATEAQARAIKAAFARAESLRNPADSRQVAFTVLPGHGIVITEKWQADKAPFEVIWQFMDSGALQIDKHVPQGLHSFVDEAGGRRHLKEG